MDKRIPWLDALSSWMGNKEADHAGEEMVGLSEEWYKTSQETDTLLHCSDHLQMAFTQIIEKYDSGL